jgi:hypothetical protein
MPGSSKKSKLISKLWECLIAAFNLKVSGIIPPFSLKTGVGAVVIRKNQFTLRTCMGEVLLSTGPHS